MTVQQHEETIEPGRHSVRREPNPKPTSTTATRRPPGGWALALMRIGIGFVFLWAFLDKLFGLGYHTTAPQAWLAGGSPTRGYLGHLKAGPLREMFAGWAGAPWADWLFMVGLAGIGLAVMLGIGLRISALTGTLMLLGMWAAEWPPARFGFTGDPTDSTNPVVDYHIIYALALIACAAAYAGHTWGLGRAWERLVRRARWLL
ncbi:DoxX family membrane protein [Pseudonocardia acaciae]|uniref:DoxX family membrane protein n=1 Tax=Pseudonocardia acaciae TaxID=551276 RepID=UPI00048A646F|nr:DoxX family membrane protein [Pseudonocardia acaciae]